MSVFHTIAEFLLTAVLFAALYGVGSLFLQLLFIHNLRGVRGRQFFSVTFALCALTFVVVLLDVYTQAYHIVSRVFLLNALQVNMVALLILISVVGPFQVFRSTLSDYGLRSWKVNSLASLVLLACLMYVSYVALPDTTVESVRGADGSRNLTGVHRTLFGAVVARVALVGVVAVGVLAGYAAFATPSAYLYPFLVRHGGDRARRRLSALVRRQRHLLQLWMARRQTIALLQLSEKRSSEAGQRQLNSSRASTAADAGGGGGGAAAYDPLSRSGQASVAHASAHQGASVFGWFRRVLDKGKKAPSTAQLEAECRGIESVSLSVFFQTSEAEAIVSMSANGSTWSGKLSAAFGILLSVYAVVKVLLTLMNMVFQRQMDKDGMTRAIEFVSQVGGGRGGTDELDGAQSIQTLFITDLVVFFNAVIVLNSIRGFLVTLFRLASQYASAVSATTTMWAFTVSMGMYFTAQILMLNASLTSRCRGNQEMCGGVVTAALGKLSYRYYQLVFDVCFVSTYVITFVIKCFLTVQQDEDDFDFKA